MSDEYAGVATGVLTPPPDTTPVHDSDPENHLRTADADHDLTSISTGAAQDDAQTNVSLPREGGLVRQQTGSVPERADEGGDTVVHPPPDGETTFEPVTEPPRLPSGVRRPATSPQSDLPRSNSAVRRTAAGRLAGGSQGPLDVGQAFGSRYHIIKVLGVGGMGAVYQAWDAELGVSVAVKVVRPEILEDPVAAMDIERRFKRELLLARQVTHRNVVRIHDLGEIDGIKYITMPYVDGADLATLLKKDTKLPVPRALRIARGVVSGLVSAHEAGVVHRDLKPANIMVGADDEPTIMDFGIARSSSRDNQGPAPKGGVAPSDLSRSAALLAGSTMAGAIIGTVEYMAPEQAKGQTVDQRADIYAFGLILYDMLIGGRRSERAASAIAELQGRMEQRPPAPRTVNPEVPATVDSIISRCLEPDPEKRFQTTVELQAAFDRLDENGKPLPIYRRVTRGTMAAAAVVVMLLLGGTFYAAKWLMAPEKAHDPVSVVIADFQNNTGDPAFDNTLGQTVRRALEDATFISAYDRSRIATLGVRPPEKLDEVAARELAVKQGLGVVLAGAINANGGRYDISVKALQTVTGEVISSVSGVASSKDQVLDTATRLVARVRKALGDDTSESQQLFAMRSMSASSLEVVSHYAAAVEAQAKGRFEEARQSYLKAVELDPKFGLGYQGLAVMSRNLGRLDEADKYIQEALRYLDSMTERERFATRGFYYRMIGDNQQCAREYGESLAKYPADSVAHNQRAGCLARLKQMREAMEEMRKAVQMLPNHTGYRTNLAILANLAGDFETAQTEVQALPAQDARALQALAYSQVGRGMLAEATATYQKLGAMGAQGASFAASGLGDLAVYEGRFADAVGVFEKGAAADLAAKSPDRAAIKFTSIGYAHLMAGQKARAIADAEEALRNSKSMPVRFLAARIFVEADALEKAGAIAKDLSAELPAEPQAHGKIIEGQIALKRGQAREAVKILTEANSLLDTWFGHFDLGRAYLAARAYPQADSEFDRCLSRRGEALSLMDEGPTYGYLPIVYYYQGRVREEMKTASYADTYREYLKIRGQSTEDPLVAEVRKRIGS
jgi:eukaryotic-like serine/threonine-protein kinase